MDLKKAIEELEALQLKRHAYEHAMGVLYLDAVTVAPSGTAEGRGRTMGVLSEESHRIFANEKTGELLDYLGDHLDELDLQTKREVEELNREYRQISRIPAEEYAAYSVLINNAEAVWHQAKGESDFASFRPYLEEIIEYNRRFAAYYDSSKKPYDALLDQYERGTSMEVLDNFFSLLKKRLVPLLRSIGEKPQIADKFLYRPCPIAKQRQLAEYLMGLLGMDRRYSAIGETEHPFTTNFNNRDVRITTHYYQDDFASGMFSVIHEGGHALYELNIADELQYTCLGTGVSMGVHESQSRFYENIIGRSKPFLGFLLPKLQELFPENFADIDLDMFYRAVNKVQPSLIRTEADELTYPFHIMVRYELEKRLMDGSLAVAELPEAWNSLYRELLGVEVPDDKHGVLQDSHWSGGSIGYFPSYALGSAYGAQMLHVMESEMDVWGPVAAGDLAWIGNWLRENIHQFGGLRTPKETVEYACRGEFDPGYYLDYLENKYSSIYGLQAI